MNKFCIKNPRHKRAVEALLKGAIPVKDLGQIIGALNPCQVVLELRRQWFENVIITRRFRIVDRDGRVCRPGEYYIPQDARPLFEKALAESAAQKHTGSSQANQVVDKSNINRGE